VEFEQLADTKAFSSALYQCWDIRNEGNLLSKLAVKFLKCSFIYFNTSIAATD